MPETTDARRYHHGNLRTALLDAAEQRLRETSPDQVTLRDLAREIGVSHAAPRRHFANRQALLDALAEAGFARLDAALRDAVADAGADVRDAAAGTGADFPARLRAAMTAYVRFATENAALLELMWTSKHRDGAERIVEAASAPFTLMHGLVVEGQELGVLPAGDPERTGLVAFATLQGIASMINGGLVRPELLDGLVETAVEQLLRSARAG
ncbi:TetR/AcrR family transcriptional regulator [Cellulomonas cellasea]|uniref:AcrR family transcriptional regulator n=1 Tax=Cellulomonas cellasea TaxID=43670 RepID=A0A7W4UGY6_9CELL|nr:TetR/AcrR family transcriptional regulator [Cellulomonas cellasea]MBB2923986.1 AcrR family transcriptional regulator [Cellulomonas cellasea]